MQARAVPDYNSLPDFRKKVTFAHMLLLAQALSRNFISTQIGSVSKKLSQSTATLFRSFLLGTCDIRLRNQKKLVFHTATPETYYDVIPHDLLTVLARLKEAKFTQQEFEQLCLYDHIKLLYALVTNDPDLTVTHTERILKYPRDSLYAPPSSMLYTHQKHTLIHEQETLALRSLKNVFDQSYGHTITPQTLVINYIQPIDLPLERIQPTSTPEQCIQASDDLLTFLKKRKCIPMSVIDHMCCESIDIPPEWIDRYVIVGGTIYQYGKNMMTLVVQFTHTKKLKTWLLPLYDLPTLWFEKDALVPVVEPPQQQ